MTRSCPKCSAKIDHDFGIVSCHSCGAILSIDFDGNVTLSDPDDFPSSEAAPAEQPAPPAEHGFLQDAVLIQSSAAEETPVAPITWDPISETAPAEAAESQSADSDSAPEFEDNWINEPEAPTAGPPPAPTGPMDFSDVVDYANSVELDNSPLVYAFRIEGIDHKDIRKKVVDVLSDIRLNLHVKDLIPTIKGGILELSDLSPIRASIIASRLREEAVTFRWRQNVFQSEAPSAESGS